MNILNGYRHTRMAGATPSNAEISPTSMMTIIYLFEELLHN